MGKIKVLYVITSLGIGGAEKLLLSYLKNLDGEKYSLFVCSLREKPDDLSSEMEKHAQVINLNLNTRFNPLVILQILKTMREIEPDIVHTHLFQARVYTAIASLFYKRSILITQKHNRVNFKKHNIFILFEIFTNLLSRRIIAISKSVRDSMVHYEFVLPKKIYLLPNCIDFQNFNKSSNSRTLPQKKEIVIGTVGRLERQKGVKYLLSAMKTVLKKYPGAILEIIGDGSLLAELKENCIKLNISNSVKFFGKFTDVIPFYNRMDVFVLPSIYEGFGIVLLEAMAAGVPIVATNVDGIKEVVVNMDSGILVPPKKPKAIANAIFKIIEDPHLQTKLVNKGFERAKLFDVKEHVKKLDWLYTDLIGVES